METTESRVRKVLVIEDEPVISQVCMRVLGAEGFDVDVAENGTHAQRLIEAQSYDFLLIDIRTPDLSGERLFHWVKENHPRVAEGVIFTTGDVLGGETQIFIERSGRPFLPKPFAPDELRNLMRESLKRLENNE